MTVQAKHNLENPCWLCCKKTLTASGFETTLHLSHRGDDIFTCLKVCDMSDNCCEIWLISKATSNGHGVGAIRNIQMNVDSVTERGRSNCFLGGVLEAGSVRETVWMYRVARR